MKQSDCAYAAKHASNPDCFRKILLDLGRDIKQMIPEWK